jgi:hypothetical protein
MSVKIPSRSHVAVLVLAFASGCSSQEPAEKTRTVTGALSAASLAGIVVPSVVAQSSTGQTFDGPVAADGTFAVKVPANITYRLFVTDLRASGRSSVESVVLWPGRLVWAAVPAGSTSDGPAAPISVGTITPVGTTADGSFSQLTNPGGGLVNGGATPPGGSHGATSSSGGAGSTADGSSNGGATSGGAATGSSGANGSTGSSGTSGGAATSSGGGASSSGGGGGDDAKGGSTGDGSSGGPTLCVPPTPSTSECNGSGDGLGTGSATPRALPPCTKPTGGGGTGSSGGTAGSTPPATPPATPPGAPSCEKDKVAQLDKEGRWDCVKMETPVTYFYSDKPMKVRASVEFPRGVLTQWYPSVVEQYPLAADMKDLVSTSSSKAKVCSPKDGAPSAANGLLDWGTLDLLGRDANVDAALPPASLDRYTWSFARQVAANPLRASSGQLEKFLFYRGVGNFSLPVRIQSQAGGKVSLKNLIDDKIGSVFFLNVTADKGTFTAAEGGIARGATLGGAIASMDGARDVDTYADDLARSVRTSLDAQGLYDDESTAMVNTWKKQWFRTPGPRLLYIAPQSWTDPSIPLAIEPKPESTKRVMVIRVEILTPEMEAADVSSLKGLSTAATSASTKSHFASLGRFAEPRLRRAIVLAGNPSYAAPLLAETVATNHTTHKPTAGTKPLTPQATGPKYGGKGFVVHEWGTDTIVVGSDGSQLLGLQHEEEDLPGFVYDRTH